jgi:hypothetical protein
MSSLNVSVYALNSRCPLIQIGDNDFEFSTRVPLDEKVRPDDTLYVTKPNDTLPGLAYTYYNDVRLWWVIYDTNASALQGNPIDLGAGILLHIPSQNAMEMELLDAQ